MTVGETTVIYSTAWFDKIKRNIRLAPGYVSLLVCRTIKRFWSQNITPFSGDCMTRTIINIRYPYPGLRINFRTSLLA